MKKLHSILLSLAVALTGLIGFTIATAPPAHAVAQCGFTGTSGTAPNLYYNGGPVAPLKFRNSTATKNLNAYTGANFCPTQVYVPHDHNVFVQCSNGVNYTVEGGSILSAWKDVRENGGYALCALSGKSWQVKFNTYRVQ